MAMSQDTIVVGVFPDGEHARSAIEDLRAAGFSDEELGFVSRVAQLPPDASDLGSSAASGAVEGGVLGGLLGAAASLLIPGFGLAIAGGVLAAILGGVALGATAGGALSLLASLGFSQEDAHFYQQALEEGKTIVTVKVDHDQDVALDVLQRNGAENMARQLTAFNASPSERSLADELPPDRDKPLL